MTSPMMCSQTACNWLRQTVFKVCVCVHVCVHMCVRMCVCMCVYVLCVCECVVSVCE